MFDSGWFNAEFSIKGKATVDIGLRNVKDISGYDDFDIKITYNQNNGTPTTKMYAIRTSGPYLVKKISDE